MKLKDTYIYVCLWGWGVGAGMLGKGTVLWPKIYGFCDLPIRSCPPWQFLHPHFLFLTPFQLIQVIFYYSIGSIDSWAGHTSFKN